MAHVEEPCYLNFLNILFTLHKELLQCVQLA